MNDPDKKTRFSFLSIRSIQTKIVLLGGILVITSLLCATLIISWILWHQNEQSARQQLVHAASVLSYHLNGHQSMQLRYAEEIAVNDEISGKLDFIQDNRLYPGMVSVIEAETKELAFSLYNLSLTAQIPGLVLYDEQGEWLIAIITDASLSHFFLANPAAPEQDWVATVERGQFPRFADWERNAANASPIFTRLQLSAKPAAHPRWMVMAQNLWANTLAEIRVNTLVPETFELTAHTRGFIRLFTPIDQKVLSEARRYLSSELTYYIDTNNMGGLSFLPKALNPDWLISPSSSLTVNDSEWNTIHFITMKEQALAYFGAVIPLKDILTPEQVVFALALPQAAAREHLWQILTSLMLTGLICFVIASLFLRFFARKISKPIQQAAQFAGCIAKGNLSKRLLLNSQDEAGRLAHEMNCMADSLAQKEQLSIALNETQSRLVETERDRADALQHAKEAAEASARFAERQRKLMSSLASSRSTDELFDKLMQHLCDAWGFNALHFQMVDHENTMLRHSFFRSTLSIDPSLIQKTLYDIPFDSRESVAATVAMRRKRFFVDQRRTRQLEKMTPFDRTIIQNLQISETLIIPIIIHNVCLGVLHLHAIRKHLELNLAAINDINLFVGNLASQIMLVRRTIELNASQTYLKTVLDTCPDAIFVHDARTGQIIDVNRSMCEIYGYHREETLTLNIEQLSEGSPPYDQSHALILMEKSLKNGPQSFEWLAKRKDGSLFWAIISLRSATIAERELIVVLVHDISSIKEAEESNMALQQQLFEARKTESIGRLAGGVAHDFNNLLGVIIGYAELGMVQVEDAHPFKPKLKQILEVAERSADLTRQLLAFARRQTIAPVSLDLNLCIETMLEMVKRLIGENITLSWKPADNLPPVKMDRSQLDQLVTNLCVNARDAIADSGTLSIETGEKEVDPVFCHSYPDCAPGKYVYFTVRDTGSGIDKAVLENIFEPFFTTKPAGKGTGLGLATIQGIVHQNNGFIQVDSHLGKGSSFTIYLPALDETLDKSLDKTLDETAQSRGGTPNSAPPDMDFPQIHSPNGLTVLVVEDEPSLMEMVLQILNVLGHKAYSTNNPDEALTLAKTHASEISILLTDVIMPSMNGKALSEEIRTFIPGIKTLFMSGYTADVIAEQGVLQKGISFIQKPFTIKSLEAAIQSLTRS